MNDRKDLSPGHPELEPEASQESLLTLTELVQKLTVDRPHQTYATKIDDSEDLSVSSNAMQSGQFVASIEIRKYETDGELVVLTEFMLLVEPWGEVEASKTSRLVDPEEAHRLYYMPPQEAEDYRQKRLDIEGKATRQEIDHKLRAITESEIQQMVNKLDEIYRNNFLKDQPLA